MGAQKSRRGKAPLAQDLCKVLALSLVLFMGRAVPIQKLSHHELEAFDTGVSTALLQRCVTKPKFWCAFRGTAKGPTFTQQLLLRNAKMQIPSLKIFHRKGHQNLLTCAMYFFSFSERISILEIFFLKINLAPVGN